MTQKALQVRDQEVLEMVVGIPIVWTTEALQDEVESALTARQKALERSLPEQVHVQESYLRALAFLNRLAEIGVSAKPLDGYFDSHPLDAELMPPLAVKILYAMETMPHPVEIEEWAVLKPAQRRVITDPYLAFRIAGRWYSVYEWE